MWTKFLTVILHLAIPSAWKATVNKRELNEFDTRSGPEFQNSAHLWQNWWNRVGLDPTLEASMLHGSLTSNSILSLGHGADICEIGILLDENEPTRWNRNQM
jgi:hypothetical protein